MSKQSTNTQAILCLKAPAFVRQRYFGASIESLVNPKEKSNRRRTKELESHVKGAMPTELPRKLKRQIRIRDATSKTNLTASKRNPSVWMIVIYEECEFGARGNLAERVFKEGIISSSFVGKLSELFHDVLITE